MDVAQVLTEALSVRRVIGLVERLLDEPRSRYRAKLAGGDDWREHIGWGPQEYLTASLIDAVQANSAITAVAGSKRQPKKMPPFYRPPAKKQTAVAEAQIESAEDIASLEDLINDGG